MTSSKVRYPLTLSKKDHRGTKNPVAASSPSVAGYNGWNLWDQVSASTVEANPLYHRADPGSAKIDPQVAAFNAIAADGHTWSAQASVTW